MDTESIAASCGRPFCFIVVFWGAVFRHYFMTLLVASLLAPNNIPSLRNKKESKLIVATTSEDWLTIQQELLFRELKLHLAIEWVDIGDPKLVDQKMKLMSRGHQLISEIVFAAKAIGVFLTPDMILSEGAVVALERLVDHGKKVVLCPAVRYEYYGCMQDFEQMGVLKPRQPLVVTGRQIMSVVLRNLHSETVTWIWNKPFYAYNPVISLWEAPGEANFIMHGYSWAPLAVDYSALQRHNTETFKLHTLDQDYIYLNFGLSEDIYVVTDSDEITMVSFTKEEEMSIPLCADSVQIMPIIGQWAKKNNLRRFHYCPVHAMDPLKRALVLKTIYLHSDAITNQWKRIARRAGRLVKSSIQRPPAIRFSLHTVYVACEEMHKSFKRTLYYYYKGLVNIFFKWPKIASGIWNHYMNLFGQYLRLFGYYFHRAKTGYWVSTTYNEREFYRKSKSRKIFLMIGGLSLATFKLMCIIGNFIRSFLILGFYFLRDLTGVSEFGVLYKVSERAFIFARKERIIFKGFFLALLFFAICVVKDSALKTKHFLLKMVCRNTIACKD